MKYSLVIGIACAAMPMTSIAQTGYQSLEAALPQISSAINNSKWDSLKSFTDGDPKVILGWNNRPGAEMPGIIKRKWSVQLITPPGQTEAVAVIWANQPAESMGDHVHKLVRSGTTWKLGSEIKETETFGYRIKNHNIDIKFALDKHIGNFTDEITVERSETASSVMQFRISSDFKVTSISSASGSLPVRQVGGVVYTRPPAGRSMILKLTYSGNAHHPDLFVGNYITAKEVVLSSYWYPCIARLPSTHAVTVTVPKGWTAIGQGDDLGKTAAGDSLIYKFKMKVPTIYFTMDAAPYSIYQKVVNGRTYQVYLPTPDPTRGNKQVELMDASFRLFEKLWGPYLWNKFTMVETSQPGWPGALEAYSFTTYGGGIIPGDNPHEWGHTWWGGFVPNTYLQDISNESLATYSESVFYRRGKGASSTFPVRDKVYWQRPFPELSPMVSTIPMSESFDALNMFVNMVGYQKGGLVMQNLEEELGFDLTQKCLRQVREEFLFSGNAATWPDFERIISKTSGQDLKWFFDQWVRRPGLPSLSWENVKVETVNGQFEVSADIVQTGTPYRLKVPVWLTADGSETIKSVFPISEKRTRIKISSASAPTKLYIDPEIRLPRTLTSSELPKSDTPGSNAVIVVSSANLPQVANLKIGNREVKLDTEVKESDLKGNNVILFGNAQSNQLWAKFSKLAPFEATTTGVRYHGNLFSQMIGKGTTVNPVDPAYKFFWYSGKTDANVKSGFGGTANPVDVGIYYPNGDIAAGELVLPSSGPTVFSFGQK